MTPETILKKAIEKAEKGGWDIRELKYPILREDYEIDFFIAVSNESYYSLIFSHDFARAFWGEKQPLYNKNRKCLHCGVDTAYQPSRISGCNHVHYPEACDICSDKEKDWKYHLEKMVLEEQPLKYLERFL